MSALVPYIEGADVLRKAGLLTLFRRQTPSRPVFAGQWYHCLAVIKELTAARQSETFTPFPF